MKFECFYVSFLFSLISMFPNGLCNEVESGILLYHKIGNHGGMCLFVRKHDDGSGELFKPFLSPKCYVKNKLWQWVRYTGGILMNLYTRRCLAVDGLKDGEHLTLAPCDAKDKLQVWNCGATYSLHLSEYKIGHQLMYDDWKVIGANVVLRKNSHKDDAKWIVYTQNDVNDVLSLCDIPEKQPTSGKKIITAIGGKQVGVSCVFPFIYKQKEMWSCRKITEISAKVICSTTSSLDNNKNGWGVCPNSKQGTVSDWIYPPLCDRPCGVGELILSRKCLYEPCDEPLQKSLNEPCNTHVCSGDRVLGYGGFSDMFPVDDVYPIIGNALFSKCVIPYIYKGESTGECVTSLERPQKWCSITEDYDKHKKWAYCSEFYEGSWSSWTTIKNSCSKTCGSGVLTMHRTCRFSPCHGYNTKTGGTCNTQPCPDCYDTKTGIYKGWRNRASDGSICKEWEYASNLKEENPLRDPSLVKNFCRRPIKSRVQPYCYILKGDRFKYDTPKPWLYCDLPSCGFDFSKPGIPYTVPVPTYDQQKFHVGGPCKFPFPGRGNEMYDRCVPTDPVGREWCRTTNTSRGQDYAYCPSFFKGRWSNWKINAECSKRCGGGHFMSYRICLFYPCEGKSVRQEQTACNTMPCTFHSPGIKDCYNGAGTMYSGEQAVTITGGVCQDWSSQIPVKHSMFPTKMALGFPSLKNNYCRNPTPGIRFAPWCYTDNRIDSISARWEYCDLVKCPSEAGQIFALPLTLQRPSIGNPGPSLCLFPFLSLNKVTRLETCQRTKINGYVKYCAVKDVGKSEVPRTAQEGIKSGLYGICPTDTVGTAGPWLQSHCSKTCGGGFYMMSRKCRNEPCEDVTRISKGSICNTQECLDCFVGDGSKYHGTYHTTHTGKECIKWSESSLDIHEGMNVKENYCRNPDSLKSIPWCVTKDMKEEYCDLRHCELNAIPYTIPRDGYAMLGEKCVLPYVNGTDIFWACLEINNNHFCPTVENAANMRNEELGVCPPSYKGTWSPWRNTTFCSKNCGGGSFTFLRNCLFHPCEGLPIKYEGSCNTHPCKFKQLKTDIDCYINNGYTYMGRVSKTASGLTCMIWSKHYPHYHRYLKDYKGVPLKHNYCRNPSSDDRFAPWCYTTDKTVRWEYCDIPHCPVAEGDIVTIPPAKLKRKCVFPFLFDGRKVSQCVAYTPGSGTKKRRYICGTSSSDINFSSEDSWGYCPLSTKGSWSAWALDKENSCSETCGGGRFRYKRICRFAPCRGSVTKKMGICNTHPCEGCYNIKTDGTEYRGSKTTAWNGSPCARRKFMSEYTNKCRNDGSEGFKSPWCIERKTGLKIPCGIRHCLHSEVDGAVAAYDRKTRTSKFCVFPYKYMGKLSHSCIQTRTSKKNYMCSLYSVATESLSQCYSIYEGTWSTWTTTTQCSKPCGGGVIVHIRHCRYPPCEGSATRKAGRCNTNPCDGEKNCYNVHDGGEAYKGDKAATMTGLSCTLWKEDAKLKYPDSDLSEAKCRNPEGHLIRPWCYVDDERDVELCNIPTCPQRPGVTPSITSISVKVQYNKTIILPCVFPFVYKRKQYHSCTSDPPPMPLTGTSKLWCATGNNLDVGKDSLINKEFGFCGKSHAGTWIAWSSADKRCTADCYSMAERYCLYEPCQGSVARITAESCDSKPCRVSRWSLWTVWSDCGRCSTTSIQSRSKGRYIYQSKSKKCDSKQDTDAFNMAGICKYSKAKNHIEEEEVRRLVAVYISKIYTAASTTITLSYIIILAAIVTHLLGAFDV